MEIVKAVYGDLAGTIGAASFAMNKVVINEKYNNGSYR